MDLLDSNYIKQLGAKSRETLQTIFDLSNVKFSDFQVINASLINEIFSKESTNLLISLPKESDVEHLLYPLVLLPVLKCFSKNLEADTKIAVGDIIVDTLLGDISSVKAIKENQVYIKRILKTNRVELTPNSPILILSKKVKDKIAEIEKKGTELKRQKGMDSLKSKITEDIEQYQEIFSYINNTTQILPANNKTKVIVVAAKIELLNTIPDFIPYQYVNKSGEIVHHTSFEPLLYVVNDFDTAKEYIIKKGIEIDTILFLGNNKYKHTSPVSELYRQGKFNRCIFIGTEDTESGDNFRVLKWNWTLPEIKYFSNATNSKINPINVSHPELSTEILNYIKIIEKAEQETENLINLKKLLTFIRKIYPTTALNNEQRIKARANIILEKFEDEAEEIFQDEYSSVDENYKPVFARLKSCYEKIISLIKNSNAKANWFKESLEIIDYVVVPNSLKKDWEKEIIACSQHREIGARVKNFTDLNIALQTKAYKKNFIGLQSAQVITLKEFENKELDNKRYLFLSVYGYNVYADTLLEKILAKNVTSNILLYDEENIAFQYYLQRFNNNVVRELHSLEREELCSLIYPQIPNVSSLDIDEWIKHLIDLDNSKFFKSDDFRYEITFEEETKNARERESKSVYVEDHEDNSKEIRQLVKGDRVRIYQNPDKETLHEIIKMTDEQELFKRVDDFSLLWKNALRKYYQSKSFGYRIDNLHEELKNFKLTVEKNRLENWLHPDNKTKFPKRKIDMLAIIKVVNQPDLTDQIQVVFALMKEYSGKLNQAGLKFSEEINNYILTKEKGSMLNWLSENHIEKIVSDGAPLRTVKNIKKLDYEIAN